jgi:hypothetical protein
MAKKSKENNVDVQLEASKVEEFKLICWDKPTKIFLGICLFLFVLGVLLKINFSHSTIWYQFFSDNTKMKKNILFGKPHTIRSDEWLVDVPSYLSQAERDYPLNNPSIGPGSSALIQGLPVKNFITVFRPLHWGFLLLDVERGVSWLWMWRTIGVIAALYLLFNILTRGKFYLSLFGSLFIYFSSGIQWWSIFTEPITFSALAFVGILGLIYSTKPLPIGFYGLMLIVFVFSFIVSPLYPPRQVPIMYLMAILTITFVITYYKPNIILKQFLLHKTITLIIALTAIGSLLTYFYLLNKDTIEIVMNTVYPGKRLSKGGDLDWTKLFSEFYWVFLNADKLPARWSNICEASGFILFFPIVFYGVIKNYILRLKQNLMVLALSIYVLVSLVYMFVGFPELIAKITFFSLSPPFRFLYGFGVTNIVLLVLYINANEYKKHSVSTIENIVVWLTSFVLIYLNSHLMNKLLENFFDKSALFIIAAFFAVIYLLVINTDKKIAVYILSLFLLLFTVGNLAVNPMSKTLDQFTKNAFRSQAIDIVKQDKDAGWIVFGEQMIVSNFLKTSGANVWSGVKYAPDMKKLHILDPSGKQDSVYNRYAHTVYMPYITSNDTVIFKLAQMDTYSVGIDPCSDKLKKIGIRYYVFTYQPQPTEVRCMELVTSNIFQVYKLKNQ